MVRLKKEEKEEGEEEEEKQKEKKKDENKENEEEQEACQWKVRLPGKVQWVLALAKQGAGALPSVLTLQPYSLQTNSKTRTKWIKNLISCETKNSLQEN